MATVIHLPPLTADAASAWEAYRTAALRSVAEASADSAAQRRAAYMVFRRAFCKGGEQ